MSEAPPAKKSKPGPQSKKNATDAKNKEKKTPARKGTKRTVRKPPTPTTSSSDVSMIEYVDLPTTDANLSDADDNDEEVATKRLERFLDFPPPTHK